MRPAYTDTFALKRLSDESGVSGTGTVAVGVRFPGGKCVVNWLTEFTSVAIYDDIATVRAIHGHGGKTVLEWEPFGSERSRSPFGRGQMDCIQDYCEGIHGHHADRLPDYIEKLDEFYQSEWRAGYDDMMTPGVMP